MDFNSQFSIQLVSSNSSNPSVYWLRLDTVKPRPRIRFCRRRSRNLGLSDGRFEQTDISDTVTAAVGIDLILMGFDDVVRGEEHHGLLLREILESLGVFCIHLGSCSANLRFPIVGIDRSDPNGLLSWPLTWQLWGFRISGQFHWPSVAPMRARCMLLRTRRSSSFGLGGYRRATITCTKDSDRELDQHSWRCE